jgi:small subunit ribosomal protein S16
MAVKMRLARMGKKRSAYYRVVVVDGRAPRDGAYIEQVGRYDPNQDPSLIEIDNEKAVEWLRKGAQPTESVGKLLEISGARSQFKEKSGRIHTVAAKPAPVAAPPAPAAAAEPAEASDSAEPEPAAAEQDAADTTEEE